MNKKRKFTGDKKHGESILAPMDKWLTKKLIDKVPASIETYHLTTMTVIWSGLIILFSYFASIYSIQWLWGASIAIVFQYITDLLDGAIGRKRNTGLIKWGYYMDHFLDYIFLCSILIGYSFIVPSEFDIILFFILAISTGFMVNSYLSFAITNEFRISYYRLGPTEGRIAFIIINTLLIIFQKTYLAFTLPTILIFSSIGLLIVVNNTAKQLWKTDMKNKKEKEKEVAD